LEIFLLIVVGYLVYGLVTSALHHREDRRKAKAHAAWVEDCRKRSVACAAWLYPHLSGVLGPFHPQISITLPALEEVVGAIMQAHPPSRPVIYKWARHRSRKDKGTRSTPVGTFNGWKALVYRELMNVVERAEGVFESADVGFSEVGSIPAGIGSEMFWRREEERRVNRYGRNPPDWKERRLVVFERDAHRCRRCGRVVRLDRCHIHHVQRRSDGGDHSLTNLVTLCRDCHSLMESHETLKGMARFRVSKSGVLHVPTCHHARRSSEVWGSAPRLLAKGLRPCKTCHPLEYHRMKVERWRPWELHSALSEYISHAIVEFEQTETGREDG